MHLKSVCMYNLRVYIIYKCVLFELSWNIYKIKIQIGLTWHYWLCSDTLLLLLRGISRVGLFWSPWLGTERPYMKDRYAQGNIPAAVLWQPAPREGSQDLLSCWAEHKGAPHPSWATCSQAGIGGVGKQVRCKGLLEDCSKRWSNTQWGNRCTNVALQVLLLFHTELHNHPDCYSAAQTGSTEEEARWYKNETSNRN